MVTTVECSGEHGAVRTNQIHVCPRQAQTVISKPSRQRSRHELRDRIPADLLQDPGKGFPRLPSTRKRPAGRVYPVIDHT